MSDNDKRRPRQEAPQPNRTKTSVPTTIDDIYRMAAITDWTIDLVGTSPSTVALQCPTCEDGAGTDNAVRVTNEPTDGTATLATTCGCAADKVLEAFAAMEQLHLEIDQKWLDMRATKAAPLAYGTVEYETHMLRTREAAREAFAAEKAGTIVLPQLRRLDTFLAEPDDDPTWRIKGALPTGGRAVLAAQKKAGKTTMMANLLWSLADGMPFLGKYEVEPVHRVVLLDNELDERMLRRWLRDQGIENTWAVELIPLRGRLSQFNILDPAARSLWAKHIGEADVVIFDCLRPALDALGLDENRDAGRFLEAFDELTTEAGIDESIIVHHMGHSGERARGDSRILDWPDAVWSLVREDADDPMSARYFSAYGRDVSEPESMLAFDESERRLTIVGGSRAEAKVDSAIPDVVALLREDGPKSQRAVEDALSGVHSRESVRAALRRLVGWERVARTRGAKGAHLHALIESDQPLMALGESENL